MQVAYAINTKKKDVEEAFLSLLNEGRVKEKQIDKKNVVFYLPLVIDGDSLQLIDEASNMIKKSQAEQESELGKGLNYDQQLVEVERLIKQLKTNPQTTSLDEQIDTQVK